MASEIGVVYLSVLPSAKGFGKELGRVVKGTDAKAQGKRLGGGILGGIGAAFKSGAALVGVGSLAAAITTPLVKGFSRLTAIENASAKLTGLGHSAKAVSAIMNDALLSVKGTAFGLDEAATTAAGSIASGVKPGKDLQRTLKLVADAATIANMPMSEMGTIFNKVAGTGKVQGEVIQQLGERGIPILQFLAKELGVTTEEAAKMASAGKINFDVFRNAMENNLGGAALESGKTTQGAFKNMLAAVGRVGANLLSGIFPYFQKTFAGITALLDPIEEKATAVGSALGSALQSALNAIVPPARAFAGWVKEHRAGLTSLVKVVGVTAAAVYGLRTAWQVGVSVQARYAAAVKSLKALKQGYALATYAGVKATDAQTLAEKRGIIVGKVFAGVQRAISMALKANPILRIAAVVIALGTALVVAYKKSEKFRAVVDAGFRAIGKAAGWLWENVLRPAWDGIKAYFDTVAGFGASVWSGLISGFRAVGDAALWLWQKALAPAWDAIKAGVAALREAAQPVVDWFNATIAPELAIIFDEVGKTIDHFRGIWEAAWPRIKSVASAALTGLLSPIAGVGKLMQWLWNTVMVPAWNGIKAAAAAFTDWFTRTVWPALDPIVQQLGQGVLWLWRTVFEPAWRGISAAVGGFVSWFQTTAWPVIQSVFGFVGQVVRDLYEKAFKPYLGMVWTQVKHVFTLIGNMIGNTMQVIRGIIQTVLSVIRGDWSGALNGLKAIGQAVWKQIQDVFRFAIATVQNLLRTAWAIITNLFQAPVEAGKKAIDNIWSNIKSSFTNATRAVKTTITNAWSTLGSIMKSPVEAGKKAIDTVLSSIEKAFTGAKDAIGNIWDGIKDKLSTPINWVISKVVNPFIKAVRPVLRTVGLTSLANNLPTMPRVGFAEGGWTGPGSKWQPAGIVHADEHVWTKAEMKKFPGGHRAMEAWRRAVLRGDVEAHGPVKRQYATGGRVKPVPQGHSGWNGGYYRSGRWHGGLDYAAPMGTPVKAAAGGVVAKVARLYRSYGHHVVIAHPDGWSTLYAHMSSILTALNRAVAAGTVIGRVGSTGNSTGPHLHFEARKGGRQLNPEFFLGGASYGSLPAMSGSSKTETVVDIGKVIRDAVGKIMGQKFSGDGVFASLVNALPVKILDGVIAKAKSLLGLQTGGVTPYSGPAWLSEDGRPELVVGPQVRNLHRGSMVHSADQTEQMFATAVISALASRRWKIDLDNGEIWFDDHMARHERGNLLTARMGGL